VIDGGVCGESAVCKAGGGDVERVVGGSCGSEVGGGGTETKAAVVYQYLTGARFKQHVQAIVEAFTTMQDDLNAEKKVMMKQWAKREGDWEHCGAVRGFAGDSGEGGGEVAGLSCGNTEEQRCSATDDTGLRRIGT
jgi:hypothetical protein